MRETVIYFTAKSAEFQIVLERLVDLPLTNIRKLFKLLFAGAWNDRNREAIKTLSDWLPTAFKNAKDDCVLTAVKFNRDWRDLSFYAIELPPEDRKKAVSKQRRLNQLLTTALKNAKTGYERLVKIQSIFNEIRESPR